MFKVGDRVKLKPGMSSCSKTCGNKIYRITDVYRPAYRPDTAHHYIVDCKCKGGVWPDEISLVKFIPKNEIECLDAFKENFKEGI